mgnify:CR=1 FL=1
MIFYIKKYYDPHTDTEAIVPEDIFEYGKKVSRSPKYQTGRGESTIIEGRY